MTDEQAAEAVDGAGPDGATDAAPGAVTDNGTDVPAHPAPPAAPPVTAPTPGPSGGAPTFPSVASAAADPGRWGRVDEDGTVWVTTADGERAVGSWQAGDAVEGLAHFAVRFDDLRTEVDLLVRRLTGGRGEARAILRSATTLRERLVDAAVVGDVVGLGHRLDAVVAAAEGAEESERAARAGARDDAVARKEALIAEAETLAEETTRWKHAGDRFQAMIEEWKSIKGIDRKTDDALWKRFSRARETFARRRGAHFAELDRARTAAKARKEELVVEAESLTGSSDWGPTAGRYKELMAEWKAAGRTSKDADDALWARFRGAQDTFFSRRSEAFSARDAEFSDNARAKEALLAEAGRIDLADVDAARAALRDVQERWDAIGKVPRERVREFSARLKEVEDRVRGAVDRRWQAADPETEARVGQFRARVEQFEAQAAKAHAAGDRRRAQEAERQAAQWREWLAAAEEATR
ncbi:DUF349 domain-containing protein [Actinomycetospora lutea]|uniref:DUF349 domain-containing protein n=1 Tax=Actinomycetospora lutea TaxID=663604 RepID=UPI0023662613|nr:DUF349 domain-containing protein [Actinomycetospora lutea]MDD7938875.1 DUF349 domain-containing protein [Actinomycetospora lutea]